MSKKQSKRKPFAGASKQKANSFLQETGNLGFLSLQDSQEIQDPELNAAIKQIRKKDLNTKVRALRDILDILKARKKELDSKAFSELIDAFLAVWIKLFRTIALFSTWQVREGSLFLVEFLMADSKTARLLSSKQLRSVITYWVFLRFDTVKKIQNYAKTLMCDTLDSKKIKKAICIAFDKLLIEVRGVLWGDIFKEISSRQNSHSFDSEAKERLLCTSLSILVFLAEQSREVSQLNFDAAVTTMLDFCKVGDFTTLEVKNAPRSFLCFLKLLYFLCEYIPEDQAEIFDKCLHSVVLQDKDDCNIAYPSVQHRELRWKLVLYLLVSKHSVNFELDFYKHLFNVIASEVDYFEVAKIVPELMHAISPMRQLEYMLFIREIFFGQDRAPLALHVSDSFLSCFQILLANSGCMGSSIHDLFTSWIIFGLKFELEILSHLGTQDDSMHFRHLHFIQVISECLRLGFAIPSDGLHLFLHDSIFSFLSSLIRWDCSRLRFLIDLLNGIPDLLETNQICNVLVRVTSMKSSCVSSVTKLEVGYVAQIINTCLGHLEIFVGLIPVEEICDFIDLICLRMQCEEIFPEWVEVLISLIYQFPHSKRASKALSKILSRLGIFDHVKFWNTVFSLFKLPNWSLLCMSMRREFSAYVQKRLKHDIDSFEFDQWGSFTSTGVDCLGVLQIISDFEDESRLMSNFLTEVIANPILKSSLNPPCRIVFEPAFLFCQFFVHFKRSVCTVSPVAQSVFFLLSSLDSIPNNLLEFESSGVVNNEERSKDLMLASQDVANIEPSLLATFSKTSLFCDLFSRSRDSSPIWSSLRPLAFHELWKIREQFEYVIANLLPTQKHCIEIVSGRENISIEKLLCYLEGIEDVYSVSGDAELVTRRCLLVFHLQCLRISTCRNYFLLKGANESEVVCSLLRAIDKFSITPMDCFFWIGYFVICEIAETVQYVREEKFEIELNEVGDIISTVLILLLPSHFCCSKVKSSEAAQKTLAETCRNLKSDVDTSFERVHELVDYLFQFPEERRVSLSRFTVDMMMMQVMLESGKLSALVSQFHYDADSLVEWVLALTDFFRKEFSPSPESLLFLNVAFPFLRTLMKELPCLDVHQSICSFILGILEADLVAIVCLPIFRKALESFCEIIQSSAFLLHLPGICKQINPIELASKFLSFIPSKSPLLTLALYKLVGALLNGENLSFEFIGDATLSSEEMIDAAFPSSIQDTITLGSPVLCSSIQVLEYLLHWKLILNSIVSAKTDVRQFLLDWIQSNYGDSFDVLLYEVIEHVSVHDVYFHSSSETDLIAVKARKPCPSALCRRSFDSNEAWFFPNIAFKLLQVLLRHFPGIVRQWYLRLDRVTSQFVKTYISSHLSPTLIQETIDNTRNESESLESSITIRCSSAFRLIESEVKSGEISLQLVIRLPDSYPISPPEIEVQAHSSGVRDTQIRRWILNAKSMLESDSFDGCITRSISRWKSNVDHHFDGVQECPICYAIVHAATNSLPSVSCRTCSYAFHSACIYRWLSSSVSPTCPMCRSAF